MAEKTQTKQSPLKGSRGCIPEASQTVYGSVRTALSSEEQDRVREPLAPLLFSSQDILGDP